MTETLHSTKTEEIEAIYTTIFNEGVFVRDSTRLATVVHIREADSPLETVVLRTPYNATGMFGLAKMLSKQLAFNFHYIVQDCRGRYNSEGEFDLFNETDDTLDTLDWVATQTWSNGKVHLFGPSYLGWVALQVLQKQHLTKAEIVSIFTPMTFSDPIDNAIYSDGVLNLHHSYAFAIMMSGRIQGPLNYINTPFPEAYSVAISKGMGHQGYPSKIWDLFLDKEQLESFTINYREDTSMKTKVTFIASYYDNICRGTLIAFEKVRNINGISPNLIIGPWGHNGYVQSLDSVGKFKITKAQSNVGKDLGEHFSILESGNFQEENIKVYILRKDEWIQSSNWPIEGDFTRIELPVENMEIQTDLLNPVQTLGGPVWENILVEGLDPGPYDQRKINQRNDVVKVYSGTFQENISFIGNVRVNLNASVSTLGAHLTAKLCIVDEEESEYILQNGIVVVNDLELRQRSINLDFSAFEVNSGERLMVEISWTNFPRYALPESNYSINMPAQNINLELFKY